MFTKSNYIKISTFALLSTLMFTGVGYAKQLASKSAADLKRSQKINKKSVEKSKSLHKKLSSKYAKELNIIASGGSGMKAELIDYISEKKSSQKLSFFHRSLDEGLNKRNIPLFRYRNRINSDLKKLKDTKKVLLKINDFEGVSDLVCDTEKLESKIGRIKSILTASSEYRQEKRYISTTNNINNINRETYTYR